MTDTIAPVAGKRYVTRSGWITPVMREEDGHVGCNMPLYLPSEFSRWGPDGRWLPTGGTAPFDLVAEYIEPIPQQPGNTPDADGWIPWHGGECPVGPDVRVDVKVRGISDNCYILNRPAFEFRWYPKGYALDIVEYRIYRNAATSAPSPEPKRVWLMDGKAYFSRRAAMATFLSEYGDETPVNLSVMADAAIEKAFAASFQAPVITEMVEVTKARVGWHNGRPMKLWLGFRQ